MKNDLFRNQNKVLAIPCAMTDNNIELPILDITNPLFISSIDENAYHMGLIKSENTLKLLKKMPGFLKAIFIKISDVNDSYLSGMRTLIYKLGPNLMKGRKLTFRDKWAVKQNTFMGLRIRLRDICRYQAEILLPKLRESPQKNLCFFNIAGGSSSDSINTLILIQEEDSELLKGRKIVIEVLDIDTFGPNFAKRSIDALKLPGGRFFGLDITLRITPFDWRNPKELLKLTLEKSDWIQVCSSEGGLFEYGSNEEIIQNLNCLYINSTDDMKVIGSMIRDKNTVNSGYLGFAEFTGIQIKFLGLNGLNSILSQTNWVLERTKEIDTVFIVFTLRKSDVK